MSSAASNDTIKSTNKHPYWNNVPVERTTIEDAPQLEYDEHHIDLIADREIDDDGLEYDAYDNGIASNLNKNRGLIKGKISSDGIIDDDFESELGGHEPTELHDTEDVDHHLVTKVEEYRIVECRGDDKFGRNVIVCSACRLPHEDVIKNKHLIDMLIWIMLLFIFIMDYVRIIDHHMDG
jgi:hypothetical protein